MKPTMARERRALGLSIQEKKKWLKEQLSGLFITKSLKLVSVLGLRVPVLLLGVRVQGVWGKMPRRHLPVCALLQEQGLLLAPAGEHV